MERRQMSATQKGVVLGALNVPVLVLLVVLRAAPGEATPVETMHVFLGLSMLLLLPGMAIGAVVGVIAGILRRFRLPVLAVAACLGLWSVGAIIVALAHAPELLPYVPPCCLPTIAMASVLERWTRRDVRVPTARVVA